MFVIGNIRDSDKINDVRQDLTYEGYGYKLYGVRFPSKKFSTSSTTDPSIGKRSYNATNLSFSPKYSDRNLIDDFIGLENGNSPFGIKECAIKYNASTGKQEIMAYKGDSGWSSAIADPEHNRMIEFPKFYYKKPLATEWVVSKDPFPGSFPSPMHYRNGVMHDKWYISKYILDSNLKSQSGKNVFTTGLNTSFPNYRNTLRNKGMYLFDYASYCALIMLLFIKTKSSNSYDMYYYGGNNDGMVTGSMDNYGLEGTSRSVSGGDIYSPSVTLGLEVLFSRKGYLFIDGIYYNNINDRGMYINTDIENLPLQNPDASYHPGYVKVTDENINIQPNNGKLGYSSIFPFAILCTDTLTSDMYSFSEYSGSSVTYFFENEDYQFLKAGTENILTHLFGDGSHYSFRSQCYID